MKYFKTYEAFKKSYMSKIDLKDFKKIKKGSKVLYMGGQVEVLKNDGYVLTLKGKDGKKFTVNKAMFDHGGQINEDEIEIKVDGDYEIEVEKDDEEEEEKKEDNVKEGIVDDLVAMGGQIDYLYDADPKTQKIWKKAGFDPNDQDNIILYSYVNSWPETKKMLDKKRVKYKELEDPNSAGESYIVFKESVVNEGINFQAILLKDAMLKYNIKPTGGIPRTLQFASQGYVKVPKGTFLIGLPGGLFAVNMKKKFAIQITSGSRAYLDAQDKLKDSDVGGTNMAPEFSQWKQYLNESMNELNTDGAIMDLWKKLYGEDFVSEYPAVAKILKVNRKNIDRRELARIWDETYGEDLKDKYPDFFKALK